MDNYFRILTEIKNAISRDDVNAFKTYSALLNYVNTSGTGETIRNYQKTAYGKLGDINLICLACKSHAEKVLGYLLISQTFVFDLPFVIHKSSVEPEDLNKKCHNAFYYAIRSNDCSLVEILIKKWPNNVFNENPDRLDSILSEAYKDLLVRNVCLSEDMELYIKKKLIDIRLYDDTPSQSNAPLNKADIQSLKTLVTFRLDCVIDNIALVKDQIFAMEPDELILVSLKYIAKNIHMLKRIILCPSNLLWEEIEFCLVICIRSILNRYQNDPVYLLVLNKKRITIHLEYFSSILIAVKQKVKTANVNKIQKLKMKDICLDKNDSHYGELHNDFTLIRDFFSLETIKNSIDLAVSADAARKEGQLLITRALQVIGEHLKYTKDAPKLSHGTNELLQSALPPDLKKIVTELRDCLSHADTIGQRTEIEENGRIFFTNMRSDIIRMNSTVNEIICEKKYEIFCLKLAGLNDSRSLKSFLEENFLTSNALMKELDPTQNFSTGSIEELEKIVSDVRKESERELNFTKHPSRRALDIIKENDQPESDASELATLPAVIGKIEEICEEFENHFRTKELQSNKIYKILQDKLSSKRMESIKHFIYSFKTFVESSDLDQSIKLFEKCEEGNTTNEKTIEECEKVISDWEKLIERAEICRRKTLDIIELFIYEEKDRVNSSQECYRNALQHLILILWDEDNIKTSYNHEITHILTSSPKIDLVSPKVELLFKMFINQVGKEEFPKGDRFQKSMVNLCEFLNFRMGKIKWIKEYLLIFKDHQKPPKNLSKLNVQLSAEDQLSMKVSLLKNLLNDYNFKDMSSEHLKFLKENPNMRSVMEMLVLDVTECLSDRFSYNAYWLDNYYPLINGKNFRNHLAHGNTLIDILFSDNFTNVLLNASKLVEEDLLKSSKKIGKKTKNDPRKLNDSHLTDLKAVKYQLKLLAAVSAGNVKEVEDCVRNGADMKGRNLNMQTTLHFAAAGPNFQLVQFAMKFNPDVNARDTNFQTALHIASAHGRLETVQYLVEKFKMGINAREGDGKTPLHLASQKGHISIVNFLLKHKADTTAEDNFNYIPVHYAVQANHINIATILLEKTPNVEEKQTFLELSAINLAARMGHLQLFKNMMEKKSVETETVAQYSNLHHASIGGNAEVVKYLIARGADVNAICINGHTSLHLSIEKDHDDVTIVLLEYGADVNATVQEAVTPLSIAAKRGNLQILKLLLEKGANVNVGKYLGNLPLEGAVHYGHFEIVQTLLRECSVNFKIQALRIAATNGSEHIVELFIQDGVDDNVICPLGRRETALHLAARYGHANLVNILIKNGCDINAIMEFKEDEDTSSWRKKLEDLFPVIDPSVSGYSKYLTQAESTQGQTALHLSCRERHREVVRCLIKNKADASIKDGCGVTSLQIMIIVNMTDIIIEENVPVCSSGYKNFSPLHLAAQGNDFKFIDYCLSAGCDINIIDENSGYTPLHHAIEMGSTEMVEYLLDKGANINARVKFHNWNVLDLAVDRNRKDMVCTLIKRNCLINAKIERHFLFRAVHAGYDDIVEYFLSRDPGNGMENAACNEYPLHSASLYGHINILKMLLEAGGGRGVNFAFENTETPLILAVQEGFCEIVQLLLSKGADPNIKTGGGFLPLHEAIRKRSIEMVKILMKAKANICLRDYSGVSAVELAILFNYLDVLKTLLDDSEVHIDFKGQEGVNLLQKAVVPGHLQIVKYLIEKGVDSFDSQGVSLIQVAAKNGHQHIVEYFKSLGLNFYIQSKMSDLVPDAAVGNQTESLDEDTFKTLLDNSADSLDFKGQVGCILLHNAIWGGKLEYVKYLIDKGVNIKNFVSDGDTAICMAEKLGHQHIVEYFVSLGLDTNI